MKLKLTLLFVFFIVSIDKISSQSIFYDAIKLRTYYNDTIKKFSEEENAIKIYATILKQYMPDSKKKIMNLESDAVLSYYKEVSENPFLSKLMPSTQSTSPTTGTISSVFSSIGGLDVTNIADGFAKFLVKRAKEELNAAFFEKLRDFIRNEKFKDPQILFPNSFITLEAIGEEIYHYEAYIMALRQAFEKDLRALSVNLPKVIEEGKYKQFFNRYPYLKLTCLSGFYLANGLDKNKHPGDLLKNFPVERYLTPLNDSNFLGSFKTLQLVSQSLQSVSDKHYWVPPDSLQNLFDPVCFEIYLGLIYQKADGINFKNNKTLRNLLAGIKNKTDTINIFKDFVSDFIEKGNTVSDYLKEFKGKKKDSLVFDDYYKYFNAAVDVFEKISGIIELPFIELQNETTLKEKALKYITIARTTSDLVIDVRRRNYNSAIMNVVKIYDFAFNKLAVDTYSSIRTNDIDDTAEWEFITGIDKSTTVDFVASSKLTLTDSVTKAQLIENRKFLPNLLKYGTFIASMVEAKNSDEVAKLIEAIALPSGSSRIKRKSDFNVSLNAYVGLFVGMEKIKSVDSSFKPNTFGVYAPIGVSISRGNFNLGKWKGHSISLFISAFDLGAVTSFRFKDDSTEKAPTIQLKDIVAPGVSLSWGFANSPISLGVGWQMGPRLRGVAPDVNNFASSKYSRLSISLSVDIPLLNFYTKSK